MRRAALIFLSALLALGAAPAPAGEKVLTVFAAASLTDVLQEAGKAYRARTGRLVRFSFAGSSTLARQIEAGAPADVFVSADEQWMDYLEKRGRVAPGTRADVASNALVLVAPADSAVHLAIGPGFPIAAALGKRGRLATGDPDMVPAGRYARAALESLGAWKEVAARVVPTDNVRAALNFVVQGEAALGIVYATDLAGVAGVREVARFPAASHPPITYPAAATVRGGEDAAQFVRFLRGPEARALFERYGFSLP